MKFWLKESKFCLCYRGSTVMSWCLNKFSQAVQEETYGEQKGENIFWYWGLKV